MRPRHLAPAAVAAKREQLWTAGFRSVAIATGAKQPVDKGWPELARLDPPAATQRPPTARALNTGILCDGLRAIDVDVDELDLAIRIEREVERRFGAAPVRLRANSPRRLILLRAAEGAPGKRYVAGDHGRVEVLGRGQQFVAFGMHPTGMPLFWRPAEPGVVRLVDLPCSTQAEIEVLLATVALLVGAPVPAASPISAPAPELPVVNVMAPPGARLTGILRVVAKAPRGSRNRALHWAACRAAEMVADGEVDRAVIEANLVDAGQAAGLTRSQAASTVRSGLRGKPSGAG